MAVIAEKKEKITYRSHGQVRAGRAVPISFTLGAGTHTVEVKVTDNSGITVRAMFVKPVYKDD